MAISNSQALIIVRQPTNSIRVTNATWIRKSNEGKVWLTKCRVKTVTRQDGKYDYLCQMQDTELVEAIWQTVNRMKHNKAALAWLYQDFT